MEATCHALASFSVIMSSDTHIYKVIYIFSGIHWGQCNGGLVDAFFAICIVPCYKIRASSSQIIESVPGFILAGAGKMVSTLHQVLTEKSKNFSFCCAAGGRVAVQQSNVVSSLSEDKTETGPGDTAEQGKKKKFKRGNKEMR